MKFCPKCETRMKTNVDQGVILCPKCGLEIENHVDENGSSSINNKKLAEAGENSSAGSLKVIEIEGGAEALPTTSADCSKCGNSTAFWWMLQTRSADEATTQFYRCTKCAHTWRNYS
jgi:transcription factor S